ncbi:ISSod8, transposase [Roseobacter sp. GAI101]|nr:ISSod8, transposase [Roseobacter sp. GAI101]
MISFKGSHYPNDVILYAVFFYVRYAVSYRDLEEILADRGVHVDHATLNRWVVKYASQIASEPRNVRPGLAGHGDGRDLYQLRSVDVSVPGAR